LQDPGPANQDRGGVAKPKEGGDGDDSYGGEKHILTHNFFVSTTIDTLPMTDVFVLASRRMY
jgi:hypothetical protein